MDEATFLRVMEPYMRAFTETSPGRRLELLVLSMTETARIYGPDVLYAGHARISEKIERFQKRWPDCRLVIASGLNVFHDAARFACAIVGPDGEPRVRGHAVVELAADGRIERVLPYWNDLPPLPAGWPPDLACRRSDPPAT